ncbi:MAG: hypothetical protein KJO20_09940 [Eudoraea sp.]|nr:hypothetical protein [Eudoraea sp.]
MTYKKVLTIGIAVFILELMLIPGWFYLAQPGSQSAIDLLLVIPVLFGINLLFGILFYRIKKPVGLLFFANAILAPLLFFAAWIMWFTYWAK